MNEIVSARRLLALRVGYGLGAPTVLALGLALPTILRAFNDGSLPMPPGLAGVMSGVAIFSLLLMVALAALFGFLAWRPYPWGKLIAAWAAIAWLGNAAASSLIGLAPVGSPQFDRLAQLFVDLRPVTMTCGLVMLGIAVVGLIADRRFIGPYARGD